jgi:hypothetical protein
MRRQVRGRQEDQAISALCFHPHGLKKLAFGSLGGDEERVFVEIELVR